MSPKDRQRSKILVILLVVLAATIWVGRRINEIPESGSGGGGSDLVVSSLADVRVPSGMTMSLTDPEQNPTRRNPFAYGPEPLPPQALASPPQVMAPPVVAQRPPMPAPPPPPPPIPFRYSGYVAVDAEGGRLTALLVDSTGNGRFTVFEGETLMGRYRILVLTEAFVEIEDLEFSRRQRIPLVIQ